MKFEEAKNLKIGSIVYNYYKEKLVIDSKHDTLKTVIFGCVNTSLGIEYYDSEYLFLDLDILSDEESSFFDWCSENKTIVENNLDNFVLMKNLYISGYGKGFSYWLYKGHNNALV